MRMPRTGILFAIAPLSLALDLLTASWNRAYDLVGHLPLVDGLARSWMDWTAGLVTGVGKTNLLLAYGATVAIFGVTGYVSLKKNLQEGHRKKASAHSSKSRDPEPEPGGLGEILEGARFPISSRKQMLAALSGKKRKISTDLGPLPAVEIADRCFSRSDSFSNREQVIRALATSTWKGVIMDSIQMMPFPVEEDRELRRRLKGRFINGRPAEELVDGLDYPISNPSQLLIAMSSVMEEK